MASVTETDVQRIRARREELLRRNPPGSLHHANFLLERALIDQGTFMRLRRHIEDGVITPDEAAQSRALATKVRQVSPHNYRTMAILDELASAEERALTDPQTVLDARELRRDLNRQLGAPSVDVPSGRDAPRVTSSHPPGGFSRADVTELARIIDGIFRATGRR